MAKRTTIEIDEDLLGRAKAALGTPTARATVDESLRRAAAGAEVEAQCVVDDQLTFLAALDRRLDLDVMRSDDMWQ